MNYELALQLKNAGFPQTNKGGIFQGDEIKTELPGKAFEMVSDPTLSELIEECGEDFGELKKQTRDGWSCIPSRFIGFDNLRFQNHSNPKEAVSELWLAINKE